MMPHLRQIVQQELGKMRQVNPLVRMPMQVTILQEQQLLQRLVKLLVQQELIKKIQLNHLVLIPQQVTIQKEQLVELM